MELDEFIRVNTVVEATKLVPEIPLHLATELTPLWHATESYLNQTNIGAPFWAFAWVGGQALARYILDEPETVEGLHVVDIGSGGGIVSIAAAMAGAAHITALDIDPVAATVCRLNAALNGVADHISAAEGDAIGYDFGQFDLILVGDVCYTRGESEDLTHHLRRAAAPVLFLLLATPGTACLVRRMTVRLVCMTAARIVAMVFSITETSVWLLLRRAAALSRAGADPAADGDPSPGAKLCPGSISSRKLTMSMASAITLSEAATYCTTSPLPCDHIDAAPQSLSAPPTVAPSFRTRSLDSADSKSASTAPNESQFSASKMAPCE